MSATRSAEALMRDAEKLARGKAGHSTRQEPGLLRHMDGRWRDPKTHQRILDLYGEADLAEPKPGFARYRIALEKLYVGDIDGAEADRQLLIERESTYATPHLAIWIALARGDKAAAKKHLEEVNAENKRKGLPRNSLSDFEFM